MSRGLRKSRIIVFGATAWLASAGAVGATIMSTGNVFPDPTTILPGQTLRIGYSGVGQIKVDGGSALSNGQGGLGELAGSNGSAIVSGAGSTWANSLSLIVGWHGTGRLDVLDGGAVSSANAVVGWQAGGDGHLTVSGPGSTMTNTGNLSVGPFGKGRLDILAGGTVNSLQGADGRPDSVIKVSGAGSTWNITNAYLGVKGRLEILSGGHVSNGLGHIGGGFDFDATVVVSGAGSTWTNRGDLFVAGAGDGRVDILAGGTASAQRAFIGGQTGRNGVVDVSGAGSTLDITGDINVRGADSGTLMVSRGGVVNAGGNLNLAVNLGTLGTLAFGIGDDGTGNIAAGLINVAGTFATGSGVSIFDLTVDPFTGLSLGDVFVLVDYANLSSGFGFSNIADDALFTAGAYTFLIDYDFEFAKDDFALAAILNSIAPRGVGVPEPGPATILSVGLAALILLRRRKRAAG